MTRLGLAALAALLLLGSPIAMLLAGPQSFADDGVAPGSAEADAWKQRLREAYDALDAAHIRHVAAQLDYSEMRHRRDERGEARAEIVAELEEAARELEAAEQQIEELLEEARRAGVLPGTLRELEREREELSDPDL